MSNTRRDGDFNLDQELFNNIAASEEGQIIADDHEDESELELEVDEQFVDIENKYGIHPRLKRRPELVNSDVLLCVDTNRIVRVT